MSCYGGIGIFLQSQLIEGNLLSISNLVIPAQLVLGNNPRL